MRVFITGASGLVGGALAGGLLDAGHEVAALVRDPGGGIIDTDRRDRTAEADLHIGDVSLPDFGMADIGSQIDCLVHCAAITDFMASEQAFEAVNIAGTRHALALARRWQCPLLHVSTAYVCGEADGAIDEVPANIDGQFTNGYEASKARAETLVRAAQREGQVAAIARPGIVVGRMSDGAIGRFDGFYHMFALLGSPLLGGVPATAHAGFALVPMDHVIVGLMAMIADMPGYDGRIAHLVAERPFAMADMLRIVADYPGTTAAHIVPPHAYDPAILDRRTAMVHRRVGNQYFSYFSRAPHFASRTVEAISGLKAPVIDEAAFRRMIDYCVDQGFLDWR
ncbi:MAG: SDR family oxidoreductase [Blastomonas sp.]